MKKWISIILVVCMVFAFAVSAEAKEKVYTVKFATTPAEGDPATIAETAWAYAMKEYIEKESDGRLVLEFYPGGQLGGHSEMVTSISSGSLEAGVINLSVMNSFDGKIMALQIPGLYSGEEEATAITNSEVAQEIYKDAEASLNVKLIGVYCNGFRSFTTKGKTLKTVEDIKGLTIRTMDDPMYVAMVKALGANPVPMAATEMYVAMQNGVVDGHENTIANVLGDFTYEVQDYMVLDKHTASFNAGIVSQQFLNSLPEDLQTILLDGMMVGEKAAYDVSYSVNRNGIDTLVNEHGMTIYEPTAEELAGWQDLELSATEEYVRGVIGDDVVDVVKAEIENYRAK